MIRLICPDCEKVLKVPETMAGKVGVCPACKSRFTAPDDLAEEAETPVEDEEDLPRRSSKRRRDDDEDDEPRPKRRGKKRRGARKSGFAAWYTTLDGRFLDMVAITAVLALVSLFIQSGAGVLLLFLWAMLISTIGSIWFVIVTLKDSVTEFLLCFFVPFYSLYYLITHFEDVKRPFFVQLFAIVPMLVAMALVAKKGFVLKM